MKTFIFLVLLVIAVAASAYADVFQFIDRPRNSYLVNCAIYISGRLAGYTDGYGRILIRLPNGTYNATLRMPKRPDRTISLSINGSNSIKIIYVP